MTVNFPTAPATGTTIVGPKGEVWVWDGAKWTTGAAWADAPPDGQLYGRQNGLWVPVSFAWPVAGVVDGSNALPGNIGEVQIWTNLPSAWSNANNAPTGGGNFAVTGAATVVFRTAVSVSIPAGDWDLDAWASMYWAYDGNNGNWLWMSLAPSTVGNPVADGTWTQGLFFLGGIYSAQAHCMWPTLRLSSAVATTMLMRFASWYNGNAAYWIRARRAR